MAMELILEGLTDSIKRRTGTYSTTKELWVSLEQLCSKVDTKDNSDSTKEISSEYYKSIVNTVSKSSSEIDHYNHEEEEEEEVTMDLEAELAADWMRSVPCTS